MDGAACAYPDDGDLAAIDAQKNPTQSTTSSQNTEAAAGARTGAQSSQSATASSSHATSSAPGVKRIPKPKLRPDQIPRASTASSQQQLGSASGQSATTHDIDTDNATNTLGADYVPETYENINLPFARTERPPAPSRPPPFTFMPDSLD